MLVCFPHVTLAVNQILNFRWGWGVAQGAAGARQLPKSRPPRWAGQWVAQQYTPLCGACISRSGTGGSAARACGGGVLIGVIKVTAATDDCCVRRCQLLGGSWDLNSDYITISGNVNNSDGGASCCDACFIAGYT